MYWLCSCQKLRSRNGESQSLDRRLCDVCSEYKDWERSLKYHLKILRTSRAANNVAEFVYVSQQISKIYTELGNFHASEKHLLLAITTVNASITGDGVGRDDIAPDNFVNFCKPPPPSLVHLCMYS